jgi:MFS family permease
VGIQIFGRRLIYNVCLAVLFAFTAAAAMAENMPQFVALRVLSGFQGCYFQITGQSILSEYFPPVRVTRFWL